MSAETADNAGIQKLKRFHMVNIKTKFPRGISDQVISLRAATAGTGVHLVRASSHKLQAASFKHQASSPKILEHQAASVKPFAASVKLKATSNKLHDA